MEKALKFSLEGFHKRRRPTLPQCSTIGAIGLNFSVRKGKRWNPYAITTKSFFTPTIREKPH